MQKINDIDPQEAWNSYHAAKFGRFARVINTKLQFAEFHKVYYQILDLFAKGLIKNLMVTIPPQTGKSEGSTRLLPPYMLGLDPSKKIAIASYASSLAKKFNASAQRNIENPVYKGMFPDTRIMGDGQKGKWARTGEQVEIINNTGDIKAVGRGGGLTGNPVDIMIYDDIYKNAMEANSPIIRQAAWDWYLSVADTRLHNDSQQLMVFTRWHEDDLIGRIEEIEKVITINSLDDLEGIDPEVWIKINFEAIKESKPSEIDPRPIGFPLWPERHSLKRLLRKKRLDGLNFDCMYQGKPESKEGLLYGELGTYAKLPQTISKKAQIDVADKGSDFLCAVCYEKGLDGFVYLTDVLFTQKPQEYTEPATAAILERNETRQARIESNSGGRTFARIIKKNTTGIKIIPFHQAKNKEAKVLTNAPTVTEFIKVPIDWAERWPAFYKHVTKFKRLFSSNEHDDGADVLSEIALNEIIGSRKRLI